MQIEELFEKRREEEVIGKRSNTIDAIRKYQNQDDVFFTMTDIEKVGINPKSSFIPAGVYCYPAGITKKIILLNDLPFAEVAPYVTIIRATKEITNLKFYSNEDLKRDIKKMKQFLGVSEEKFKEHYDESEKISWGLNHKVKPAALLINLISGLSNFNGFKANQIFRKLGHEILYDPGYEIIYEKEPTQAVFLSPSSYKVLERLPNIDSYDLIKPKDMLKMRRLDPDLFSNIRKVPDEVLIRSLSDPFDIEYIQDPSEKVQLYAVKKEPKSILYIDAPTENVQIYVISQDPKLLDNISNPTEKVKQLAKTLSKKSKTKK